MSGWNFEYVYNFPGEIPVAPTAMTKQEDELYEQLKTKYVELMKSDSSKWLDPTANGVIDRKDALAEVFRSSQEKTPPGTTHYTIHCSFLNPKKSSVQPGWYLQEIRKAKELEEFFRRFLEDDFEDLTLWSSTNESVIWNAHITAKLDIHTVMDKIHKEFVYETWKFDFTAMVQK